MASNGILNYAKTGKCRICYRVRKTTTQVTDVGEIYHGYATGHEWQCIDSQECTIAAKKKIVADHYHKPYIEMAMKFYRV